MIKIGRYFGLFAAAVLVMAGTKSVQADEVFFTSSDEIFQTGGIKSTYSENQEFAKRYLSMTAGTVSVEDAIYNGLSLAAESIDISAYHLTGEEMKKAYVSVLNKHGDLFYVQNSWQYSLSSSDFVQNIFPSYAATGSELSQMQEEFQTLTGEIMDQVDDSWSDMEKALFYHDYICTNFEYDTSLKIHDAYQFLTEKKGVCQAYTLLYGYFLNEEGIANDTATSDSMNHIWNVVSMDGNWYHVDVTWDDPVPDTLGNAKHGNFLRSDEGIALEEFGKHYDWVSDVKCTSDKYEEAFWKNVNTNIVFAGDKWYCMEEKKRAIYECDVEAMQLGEAVCEVSYYWSASSGGYYVDMYSGFGVYEGKLYYNSPTDIYAYDITKKTSEKVYTPVLAEKNNIYGFHLSGNNIIIGQATQPQDNMTIAEIYPLPNPLPDISVTIDSKEGLLICSGKTITPEKLEKYFGEKVVVWNNKTGQVSQDANIATGDQLTVKDTNYDIVVKGDVDGNGQKDVFDMEAIQKHILGISELTNIQVRAGKLNNPLAERLSVMDMQVIQQYILGIISGI